MVYDWNLIDSYDFFQVLLLSGKLLRNYFHWLRVLFFFQSKIALSDVAVNAIIKSALLLHSTKKGRVQLLQKLQWGLTSGVGKFIVYKCRLEKGRQSGVSYL